MEGEGERVVLGHKIPFGSLAYNIPRVLLVRLTFYLVVALGRDEKTWARPKMRALMCCSTAGC